MWLQEGETKDIGRKNDSKFSKFDENSKFTDPRILANPKQKKHEENYTEVHHNQTVQKQW